jgi:hypothetical protein
LIFLLFFSALTIYQDGDFMFALFTFLRKSERSAFCRLRKKTNLPPG